ncbi:MULTISPECIES: zinc metallochaperone AztD [unclassified Luteococcus]|uniref:zinc metallochaperone AztD n=1 Tax=unclassified Luteococcus TaxID=2639923 RepID=UPI00313B51F8
MDAAGRTPRLAVTYAGGVQVIDAEKGEKVADFPLEGFTRLNQAGNGRHLLVTEGDHFKVLDMGVWSHAHGDHYHSRKTEPLLTDMTFQGSHPGHAVHHGGRTALFYDGEGRIEWFEPTGLSVEKPQTHEVKLPKAHHGVAVFRDDDSLVHTVGDDKVRTGIAIQDGSDRTVAQNTDCPGVHGEASAKGALSVGCEDGILVIKGNKITKVKSPDSYGRIGNQAGSEKSTVVLGDYKVDKKAELERPTRITLTDTATGDLKLVDVQASYSFRSLGRGADGEALVLGTDGRLRVIDPKSGRITSQIPVTRPWTEPTEWQKPRPTLFVQEDQVWVSEPASKRLHRVDLAAGKVSRTVTLDRVPNELSGVRG